MLATVDWANVTVAAAFVLGMVVGTAATITVMRVLIRYLRQDT